MGLDIKEKWTLGGNAPGEPIQPAEIGIGAPISGLYLREDVELKCNFLMTRFVRKQLKDALATLVARLLVKSQLLEAADMNKRLEQAQYSPSIPGSPPPPMSPPMSPGFSRFVQEKQNRMSTMSGFTAITEMEAPQRSPSIPDRHHSRQGNQFEPVELPT